MSTRKKAFHYFVNCLLLFFFCDCMQQVLSLWQGLWLSHLLQFHSDLVLAYTNNIFSCYFTQHLLSNSTNTQWDIKHTRAAYSLFLLSLFPEHNRGTGNRIKLSAVYHEFQVMTWNNKTILSIWILNAISRNI